MAFKFRGAGKESRMKKPWSVGLEIVCGALLAGCCYRQPYGWPAEYGYGYAPYTTYPPATAYGSPGQPCTPVPSGSGTVYQTVPTTPPPAAVPQVQPGTPRTLDPLPQSGQR